MLAGALFKLTTSVSAQALNTAIDLDNPIFQQHASLPLNEMYGPPIIQSLQPLIDRRVQAGKTGTTVYNVMNDEDSGIAPYANVPAILADLVCRADIAVIGTPESSLSHLTASAAAIYSDYDLRVSSVIRKTGFVQLQPGGHLVLTRPGGALPGSGGFIQYDNGMLPRLRIKRTYLLFLNAIQATGAYQPASDASGRQVFSTLELLPSGTQWRIYRGAYMERNLAELAGPTLQPSLGSAAAKCK